MRCLVCENMFEERAKTEKYCSNPCRYAAHKEATKSEWRKKSNYYGNKVKALEAAGYTVIPPKEENNA